MPPELPLCITQPTSIWSCTWNCTSTSSATITQQLLFELKTMAAATQRGISASSFLCPSSIAAKQFEPTRSQSACRTLATPTLVVCQQHNTERKTANVSRRLFAAAAASATAWGVIVQPEAQARRRPPPQEEKKVEPEEKNLGVNEARILANARRKEALKATVEAAKAKAKSIVPSIKPPE